MRRPAPPNVVRLTVVGFLGLAIISRSLVHASPGYRAGIASLPTPLAWLEQPLRWTLICAAGLYLLHGLEPARWARDLGLTRFSPRAIGLSILATTPLLIGPLILGAALRPPSSGWFLLFTALLWPWGEELLYRGFAFGQLTTAGGLRLWPAALLTGLVFGTVHLSQASVQGLPLAGQVGTVALITAGGVLFSWLFARWDRSIWPPLAVHGLLNLGWALWNFDPSPYGTVSANALRLLSVLLVIGLTWRHAPTPTTVAV